MKISSATLLMVLVCLAGAVATSSMIVSQYQTVQALQLETENTRLTGRDLQQLKVMMSQWYVGIDLFFEDADSYVARGISRQAQAIEQLWGAIAAGSQSQLEDGKRYISQASQTIEALALSGPSQSDSWNQGLTQIDEDTTRFVALFEEATQQNATSLILAATRLAEERDQLSTDAWSSALIYLLTISLAWMWANRQIVQPITALEEATRSTGPLESSSASSAFELQRGPSEIQQLGRSLSRYVKELASKNQTINKQKEKLEQQLAELERTRDDLVRAEKLASVGQLAAGIAHEINNPMSFVTSNLSSLSTYIADFKECLVAQNNYVQESDTKAPTPESKQAMALWKSLDIEFLLGDCDDVLVDVKEGTDRITQIVKELSEFTDQSHAHDLVDLNRLTEKTIERMTNELDLSSGPGIVTQFHEPLTTVCAPERVAHAISAVLENAIEANSESSKPVRVRTGCDEGRLWIEVADNGPGIPEEQQLKIFDPFFTTKPVGASLGLSLHFVQSIIDQHDGRIVCHSNADTGTTMRLELPMRTNKVLANQSNHERSARALS